MEITITKAAKDILEDYFAENPRSECLRVYLRPRQDSRGRSLALKPDTKTERDLEYASEGYSIALSRHLADQIGQWITIDSSGQGGFVVTADNCSEAGCPLTPDV